VTRALEKAFEEAAKLPPEEQDRIGSWLLSQLTDERAWEGRFRESQDALGQLADEATRRDCLGETTELDPTKL
jgi:CHAD domain-containing protein